MISFSHKFTFLYFLSHILISFPILPYHFANRMPIVKISLSIRYQLIQIEIHFLLLISYEIEYALLFVIFNPFQLSLPLEIILLSCCILSRLYISKDKDKYLCKSIFHFVLFQIPPNISSKDSCISLLDNFNSHIPAISSINRRL